MSISWGFTFSQKYTKELGLDWKKTFKAILAEYPFSSVRLCAYWDLIETQKGVFNFEDLDWQIKIAGKKNLEITLAFGRKVPRWPEYHDPLWSLQKDRNYLDQSFFVYLNKILKKYENHSAIKYWQIENEPFWDFGKTKFPLDKKIFLQEIKLVRAKSKKKIIITHSGEGEDWKKVAKYGDRLGVNIYSIVYNQKRKKYCQYKYGSDFYRKKKEKNIKDVFVSELQAEPWGSHYLASKLFLLESKKSMNANQLKKNVHKAIDAGFGEIWFWGVEWWIYIQRKDPTIGKMAKQLMVEF